HDSVEQFNQNSSFLHLLKSCRYFNSTNDLLIVPHLDTLACQLLVTKFPNLRMLLIYGCSPTPRDLGFLLTQWTQLECFSLLSHSQVDFGNGELFASLKRLSSLKHLALSSESVFRF